MSKMDPHHSQIHLESELDEQSDASSYGSSYYIAPEVNKALSNISRGSEIKVTFPNAPEDVHLDRLFGFEKAEKMAGTFEPDVVQEDLTPDGVVPHRIFVNQVDSFFGRHFVKFLLTAEFSFPRDDGKESSVDERSVEEEEEEEVDEEEEELNGEQSETFDKLEETAKSVADAVEEEEAKVSKEGQDDFGDFDSDPFSFLFEDDSEEESEKDGSIFPEQKSEVDLEPTLTVESIGSFDLRKLRAEEYQELLSMETEETRLRFLKKIINKRRKAQLKKTKEKMEKKKLKELMKKIKYSKTHKPFEIYGTLEKKLSVNERQDEKFKYLDSVNLVDDIVEDREKFLSFIMTCGTVVFNVTPCRSDQAELAKLMVQAVTGKLQEKALDDPEKFKANISSRTFLLISPLMTWAHTVPLELEESEDASELPFLETDYRRRIPHENFLRIYRAENEMLNCGRKFGTKLKTLVVNTGILYGHEEEVLDVLFLHAWCCETDTPLFDTGANLVPLIDVDALSESIFKLIRESPFIKPRLIFAMEKKCLSLREICQAISILGTGDLTKIQKEDAFNFTQGHVDQITYDFLTVNLNMTPKYLIEHMDLSFEDTFVEHQEMITQEYIESNRLQPVRIIIEGLPMSGKTTLAMRLCSHYNIYYLNRDTIVNLYRELLTRRERHLKTKQMDRLNEEANDNEDETEDDAEWAELEEMNEIEKKLIDLSRHLYEHDGKIADDETMVNIMIELLYFKRIRNVGYVLDGWPDSYDLLKDAFETNETIAPNVFIKLNIHESLCLERIYNLSEDYLKVNPVDETHLIDRLFAARETAGTERPMFDFFEEHEREVRLVNVDADQEINFCRLSSEIGKPRDKKFRVNILLGENVEIAREDEPSSVEIATPPNEADLRREKLRAFATEQLERRKRTKEDEDRILAVTAERLRRYAARYLMPTLSKGLMEAIRTQPSDPVDFLADYLFRQNPDGKMLTEPQRKIFGSAHTTVEEEEEQERFRQLQAVAAQLRVNRNFRS